MKKLLCLFVCVFSSFIMFGQTTIDSVNTKAIYCEIVGIQGYFTSKLIIKIDYGQEIGTIWKPKDKRLIDEGSKPIKFNSMIDVLNLMSAEGWCFITAYTTSDDKYGHIYHWLLKRNDS